MSDHHIECISILYWPLILISYRWVEMMIFLFIHFKTEEARTSTSHNILDHTDTEFVPLFLMYRRLDKSLSWHLLTDTFPLWMMCIDDELAFDLEVDGHI